MPIPPIIAALPQSEQNTLLTVAKPKLDAYFSITSGAGNVPRSILQPQGYYLYPNQTMIPDIVYLWAVFIDIYAILGGATKLAAIVRGDPNFTEDFRRIVEGSSSDDPDGSLLAFPREESHSMKL